MVALAVGAMSFLIMGAWDSSLAGLIVGVILLDLGVQSAHVSNQTRIYAIDPAARSRLNMVYMVCYFSGGALGSYAGAHAWQLLGWRGVCGFGAVALGAGALLFTRGRLPQPR
jgi:predicted MFS family arabinose efflux permease